MQAEHCFCLIGALMRKKDKHQELVSLIYNPKTETQEKENPVKTTFRVCVVLLLFLTMFCSFLMSFSGQSCFSFKNKLLKGTFDASNYYDTKNCSLIIAKPVEKMSELKIGDEVFYSSSSETASAIFKGCNENIVYLEKEDGSLFTINKSYVLGVVTEKKPVIGVVFAYFQTSVGGIVSMVLLLALTSYFSFSKINYENTEEGKRLLLLFRKKKKEDKERKKILFVMKNVEGVEQKIVEMLSGEYKENKREFEEFEKDKFPSLTKKYEYVLFCIHEALVVKDSLSREERMCVTSLLELIGEITSIDQNIEYMMIDLLLKGSVVDFDEKIFESNISVLLSRKLEEQDLLNLGSILYIMFKTNPKIKKNVAKDILLAYSKKAEEMGSETQNLAKYIAFNISEEIK